VAFLSQVVCSLRYIDISLSTHKPLLKIKNELFIGDFFMIKKQTQIPCHPELNSGSDHRQGSSGLKRAAFTFAEGGRRLLLNSGACRAAFTLAEILITLAVIGIVAVLTIPGVVKNHQEKAWSTAQDLFSKKLEVAMKAMATNSTVSGYDSTESFVNELKKYLKITNICTDDVTKCFADKVVWNAGDEPVEVTNSAVTYDDTKGDWAETVGIQLNNGVNALIAYNKQCDADPYNNQEAVSANCVGIIYDVSGFKTPNTNGKDILANSNIKSLGNTISCIYKLSDGTCITKILSTKNGGFGAFPMTINGATVTCDEAKQAGLIDNEFCHDNDYYAGAVYACGGKKANLPTEGQLITLAQYLYNDKSIGSEKKSGLTLDSQKAEPFLTQSPISYICIWSNWEVDKQRIMYRDFYTDGTAFLQGAYHWDDQLAVCVAPSK